MGKFTQKKYIFFFFFGGGGSGWSGGVRVDVKLQNKIGGGGSGGEVGLVGGQGGCERRIKVVFFFCWGGGGRGRVRGGG